MMKAALLIIASAVLILSCKKEEPPINRVPFLELVSVDPDTVTQFQQPILVNLKYEDHDGDLGFPNPDSLSLEVQDSRLPSPDYYHVPPLSPVGQELFIRGDLQLQIPAPFLLGTSGVQENMRLTIRIRDRAGNVSNAVITPDIIITP